MQGEQLLHFQHVIAASEAQQGRAQQVHAGATSLALPGGGIVAGLLRGLRSQQPTQHLIEGF